MHRRLDLARRDRLERDVGDLRVLGLERQPLPARAADQGVIARHGDGDRRRQDPPVVKLHRHALGAADEQARELQQRLAPVGLGCRRLDGEVRQGALAEQLELQQLRGGVGALLHLRLEDARVARDRLGREEGGHVAVLMRRDRAPLRLHLERELARALGGELGAQVDGARNLRTQRPSVGSGARSILDLVHMGGRVAWVYPLPLSPHPLDPPTRPRAPLCWALAFTRYCY